MSDSKDVLRTPRLLLRRFDLDDADFILELLNEPSFIRYIGDKGVRNRDDAREYLNGGPLESYERHGYGLYMVLSRDGSVPLGMCGILKRDELEDPDIGFAFLPRFWSKGYASESAAAVLDYGRNSFGMKRIVAITATDNSSSIRLLTRLGFKFERTACLSDEMDEVNFYAIGCR
jgi:RimJ/RimL family protein N-acetyltransferase